jgi:hypothetical protein
MRLEYWTNVEENDVFAFSLFSLLPNFWIETERCGALIYLMMGFT